MESGSRGTPASARLRSSGLEAFDRRTRDDRITPFHGPSARDWFGDFSGSRLRVQQYRPQRKAAHASARQSRDPLSDTGSPPSAEETVALVLAAMEILASAGADQPAGARILHRRGGPAVVAGMIGMARSTALDGFEPAACGSPRELCYTAGALDGSTRCCVQRGSSRSCWMKVCAR
jgi:hypothetical protein